MSPLWTGIPFFFFFLVFVLQQLFCDVLHCFLCIFPLWESLYNFLNLWLDVILKLHTFLGLCYFKYCFCQTFLLHFWYSDFLYMRSHCTAYLSQSFLYFLFFFLCASEWVFSTDLYSGLLISSSALSNLLLNPSTELLIQFYFSLSKFSLITFS